MNKKLVRLVSALIKLAIWLYRLIEQLQWLDLINYYEGRLQGVQLPIPAQGRDLGFRT